MATLEVIRLGHPVLRKVAEPYTVEEIRSPQTRSFLEDMFETMDAYDGAGLAAPQVAISKRMFVYGVGENPRYPEAPAVPRTVLFNPSWERLSDETELEWEGCLSLPGLRGQVRRFDHILVKALDQRGEPVEFEAHEFHARVFQHEYDHLDGVVFVDRMEDMTTLTYLREWYVYQLGVEFPDEDELELEGQPEACRG